MAWELIASLKQLQAEFNKIAPSRDKASDGTIGDTAHASSSSDHNADEVGNVPIRDADKKNEVHAIDVDRDLRESDLTMERVVQFLLSRCRSGVERRLRYIIFNRRIWSASSGWVQKSYDGANPHDKHAHFSGSYDSAREASAASWHLEDIPVALTASDKAWIKATVETAVKSAVKDGAVDEDTLRLLLNNRINDFLDVPVGSKEHPNRTVGDILREVPVAAPPPPAG